MSKKRDKWHPRQNLTRRQRRDRQHMVRRRQSDPLQKAIGDSARWLAAHVVRLHAHVAQEELWIPDWVRSARSYFALTRTDSEGGLLVAQALLDKRIDLWIGRLQFPPRTKGGQILHRAQRGWERLRECVEALAAKLRREEAARRLGRPERYWEYAPKRGDRMRLTGTGTKSIYGWAGSRGAP